MRLSKLANLERSHQRPLWIKPPEAVVDAAPTQLLDDFPCSWHSVLEEQEANGDTQGHGRKERDNRQTRHQTATGKKTEMSTSRTLDVPTKMNTSEKHENIHQNEQLHTVQFS